MGRSRRNVDSTDDSRSQRSRRKKDTSIVDYLESFFPGESEGKKGLYHCNYCGKDISEKIRIKCAVCLDFDLCVECFSVGAEVSPHSSSHSYRVEANQSFLFPLVCPDWHAAEEMLLIEGLGVFGFGNLAEVAEHVGTKSKEQCIEHYDNVYLNSPDYLPDMSLAVGKTRDDLLALANSHGKEKKDVDCGTPSEVTSVTAKVAPNKAHNGGRAKVGDRRVKRRNRKARSRQRVEEPSLLVPSGYNAKRHEFECEYDNDAEKLLAELEFAEDDTEEEHELKLRVLRSYSKRLDERNRRKDFIVERNLLQPSPFENNLSPEERAICQRYDIYMRFHSKEEHDDLLQTVVLEHRSRKRIQELEEARAAGCRTSAEADRYFENKRKMEAEGSANKAAESPQVGSGSHGGLIRQISSRSVGDLHARVSMIHLLSDAEKRLCSESRLHYSVYLKIQETIAIEILKGNVKKKSDAHRLFKLDPVQVDRIYDMLVNKGIAPA